MPLQVCSVGAGAARGCRILVAESRPGAHRTPEHVPEWHSPGSDSCLGTGADCLNSGQCQTTKRVFRAAPSFMSCSVLHPASLLSNLITQQHAVCALEQEVSAGRSSQTHLLLAWVFMSVPYAGLQQGGGKCSIKHRPEPPGDCRQLGCVGRHAGRAAGALGCNRSCLCGLRLLCCYHRCVWSSPVSVCECINCPSFSPL